MGHSQNSTSIWTTELVLSLAQYAVCSNVVDFQNFAAQTESYLHDALHSKNCQADEYGRPDEGSDPTFGVGCIAYASNWGLLSKPLTELPFCILYKYHKCVGKLN